MRIHHSPCTCPDDAVFNTPCFVWLQNLGRPCEVIRFTNASTAFMYAVELSEKEYGYLHANTICDLMLEIQEKSVLQNEVDEILSSQIFSLFQTVYQNGMFGYGTVLCEDDINVYCSNGVIYRDWKNPV